MRYTASTNSAYCSIITVSTHTNKVCYYIKVNYTWITHRVGIYKGTVALYCDLTGMSISYSKTKFVSRHDSSNNIWNNETRLRYNELRYISTYHTITHGYAPFDTLQGWITWISGYQRCPHILNTLCLYNIIIPQWPIESEFIRE